MKPIINFVRYNHNYVSLFNCAIELSNEDKREKKYIQVKWQSMTRLYLNFAVWTEIYMALKSNLLIYPK